MSPTKSKINWLPNANFSVLFLVLHIAGTLFALWTLSQAWNKRDLFEILLGKSQWFLFLCIIAVLLLGVTEASRSFLRWRKGETEVDVGLRLRGLIYVAVGCLIFDVTILWIPFPLIANISVTIAYGVYLLWQRRLSQIRRRVTHRLRRGFDIVCMNVVLGLILAEVSLRIVAVVLPMPLLMTSKTTVSDRLKANRFAPGTVRFGFPTNAGGHYDTPFETKKKKVVVSIGDSFSAGAVPHSFHFTTVCERELPDVDVYNMGFPAIGPREYLQLLESEALPLNPDLVVFQIFIGNDLTEALTITAEPARWYNMESYKVAVLWQRLRVLKQERRIDLRNGLRDAVPEHDELAAQFSWLANPLLEKPTLSEDLFLKVESQRAQAICGSDEFVYHHFFKSLKELDYAAGNVSIAFVLIPGEFQVNDGVWEQIEKKLDPSGQPYDRDRPQKKILEWLKGRGLPVLDLLPALRAAEPLGDGKRHVYHLQDTHFNARGNEIAGQELADFVEPIIATPPQRWSMVRGASGGQPGSSPPHKGTIKELIFGQPLCRESMIEGWSNDEAAADDKASRVWSQGPKSVLGVTLPVGEDLVIEFECQPFLFPGSTQQSIEVFFNDSLIGYILLSPGRNQYSISVSKDRLADTTNIIDFRYGHSDRPIDVLPDSNDERSLAVYWYSLFISRPADDGPAVCSP